VIDGEKAENDGIPADFAMCGQQVNFTAVCVKKYEIFSCLIRFL
jgi:hypothetical protein